MVSHKLCTNDRKKSVTVERIVEGIYSSSRTIKEEEKLLEKRIITKEQRRSNYILPPWTILVSEGAERFSFRNTMA